jgi:exonuclease VII small subunit
MTDCQKMAQNAINLASQATRALTISDWSPQDCEEFLEDVEKEFRKVSKALDTYSPQECEPAVKRKISDCRLRLEAAQFEAEKVVTRLLKDHEVTNTKY